MKTKYPLGNCGVLAWVLATLLAACSPPAHWIAVADADNREIVLFRSDLSPSHTMSLAAHIFDDTRTLAAVFGRDGVSFYVADSGSSGSHLSLIRRLDGRVLERRRLEVGSTPRSLSPTRDGRGLIVTVGAGTEAPGGAVVLFSADLGSERARIEACGRQPDGVAVLSDLNRAYVRCGAGEASLVEIDLSLARAVKTVVFGRGSGLAASVDPCGPGGIALSPSGSILLLPCSARGMLLYVDRLTLQVLDSVAVGTGARDIAVSPRQRLALLTFPDSNAVSLIELSRGSVLGRIALPGSPSAVAVSGDGKTSYVLWAGGSGSGGLTRLDSGTLEILNTVAATRGWRSLSVWPGSWTPTLKWK